MDGCGQDQVIDILSYAAYDNYKLAYFGRRANLNYKKYTSFL